MQHFFDWYTQHEQPHRPWLVLGKGPTFGLRARFDLSAYNLLSLNHAVREQPVLIAHMIDLDVVDACAEALLHQAAYVALPWYPHVGNAPGARSLENLVPDHSLLRRLDNENRLLWYDLNTASRRHGPGPVVQATYFSAEAAVSLLALAGARCVRSLGVDGGATYSGEFADLRDRTLLSNGRPAFDLQFQGIARTIQRTGLDFAPLDVPSPVVIQLSGDPANALPARVLEYAVRRRTSMTVRAGGPDTGSHQAIVLAPGALVLDDLRKVWARPTTEGIELPENSKVEAKAAPPAIAVVRAAESQSFQRMCVRARALLDSPGRGLTAGSERASIPSRWNSPDRFDMNDTAILHYAAPHLRPWVSTEHPCAHIWIAELLSAVREGLISSDLIRSEVQLGHVRPSLMAQVDLGLEECLLLPRAVRRHDAAFTPPGGVSPARSGPLSRPMLLLRAAGRQVRRRAKAYRQRYASAHESA